MTLRTSKTSTRKTKYETHKGTQLKEFLMDCEIIELPDDVVYGKPEYKGRCILLIAKITPANNSKYWVHCYKCHVVAHLDVHTVSIIDEKVTLDPSVLCPVEKCKEHYFIRDGKVC